MGILQHVYGGRDYFVRTRYEIDFSACPFADSVQSAV